MTEKGSKPAVPNSDSKEIMITQYKAFSDSFWRNEELGERRVNFLITLVTAVIAALVGLREVQNLPTEEFLPLTILAVIALLLLSVVTWRRMLKRNRVTDEYKRAMGIVSNWFEKKNTQLKAYRPFPDLVRYWLDYKEVEKELPEEPGSYDMSPELIKKFALSYGKVGKLLFSVELDSLTAGLTSGVLSAEFKQSVERHGIKLSDNVTVETLADREWRIKDKNTGQAYIVRGKDGTLNIHVGEKPPKERRSNDMSPESIKKFDQRNKRLEAEWKIQLMEEDSRWLVYSRDKYSRRSFFTIYASSPFLRTTRYLIQNAIYAARPFWSIIPRPLIKRGYERLRRSLFTIYASSPFLRTRRYIIKKENGKLFVYEPRKPSGGGLAEMVSVMNSVFIGVLLVLGLLWRYKDAKSIDDALLIIIGFLGMLVAFIVQWLLMIHFYDQWNISITKGDSPIDADGA